MAADLSARVAGRYEILGKMGEGGMGAIYRVRHRLLDVVRVAKVLQPQFVGREEWQKRFLREAKIASRLKHRSLAQLHDFDLDPARGAWMIMELIEGCDLRNVLRHHGPPSLGLALEIARQSLAAFDYLHSNDLVHRDVSPDNLMLTRGGRGEPEIKLIDLGIAKRVGAGALTSMTADFVGKYRYSSPEQLDASSQVDHRSDLYSLGLVLYELITGHYPFRGETPQELASAHWFQEPQPFDVTDPQGRIPSVVRQALLQSLQKDAGDRFASATAFARALAIGPPPDGEDLAALAAETESILEATTRAMPPRSDADNGSTQQHLDQVFDAEATPFSTPTGPTRVAVPAERRAHEVSRLIAEAKAEMLVGDDESARAKLDAALELEPENDEARATWRKVEGRIERQAQIDALAGLIQEHLAAGDLAQARRSLDKAASGLGEVEAFSGLRLELDSRLAARSAELETLLAKARRQRDGGDLEAALATVTRALELDRTHGPARSLESELRLERGRQAKVGEAVTHIEEKLAAADFAAVDRLLRAAHRELGEHPRLAELARRADRQREDAARDLVAKARQEIARREWRRAGDHLRRALDLAPEYDEALDLAMHVRGENRKAAGIQDARETIRALLGAGDLAEARARLQQAVAEFGWSTPLTELDRELQERAAARQQEVAGLLAEADRLSQAGELTRALSVGRQALTLDESSAAARSLVGELESAVERHTAIDETVRAGRALVSGGRFEAAARELARSRERLGDDPSFSRLQSEIDQALDERRARRIDERLASATSLSAAGRWRQATDELRAVLEIDAAHGEARRRLRAAERELERQSGRAQAAAKVRKLLDEGRLDLAQRRLEEAETLFGESADWDEVRQAVARATSQRQKIDAHLEAAERLRGERKYREAILEVQKARKVGRVPESDGLLEELRRLEQNSREIFKAARAVSRAIARGDLGRAETLLTSAEEAHGAVDELRQLRDRLTEKTISERQAWLDQRISEAESRLAAGQPSLALAVVQEVIEVDPSRQEARQLLQRIERRIEQQRAGRREVEELARGIDQQKLEKIDIRPLARPERTGRWLVPLVVGLVVVVAALGWKLFWWSGTVDIAPVPAQEGLAVWLDGADTGRTAPATLPLRGLVGRAVELELRRAGEVVAATRFELGPEAPRRWDPRLSVQRTVDSRPPGARVVLDGEALERPTPVTVSLDPDPEREHSLRLELDGHRPLERAVSLAEWTEDLRFELQPVAQPGSLQVRAPYPVQVRVAGQRATGRSLDLPLDPGRHQVTLTAAPLFFSRQLTVDVPAGGTRRLTDFPPAVSVWVLSVPGNAELLVDNRSLGELPREVSLVAGRHRFEFKWPDRSFAESVEIAADTSQVSSDASRILVE